MINPQDSPIQSASPTLSYSTSPSIDKSDDEVPILKNGQTKSYSSSGEFIKIDSEKNRIVRTASQVNNNKSSVKETLTSKAAVKDPTKTPESPLNMAGVSPNLPSTPSQPAPAPYMGDILDDIFGGSFRTPGVKASEDILTKAITPALAFEELENIRNSPTLFMLFYADALEHKVLESLHFILEVEEFLALPLDFRVAREREIVESYLTTGAVFEINIPDNTRKIVSERMGTKCEDIFSEVQKYITHMLIRNVDSNWSYKKVPPPKKELKGKQIQRAIDRATTDQRIRDLIFYFIARRITPLMYQARTSVVSLQRKVRTSAPLGWAIIKIKQLTGFPAKTPVTLYIVAQCFYQNQAGILRDKKSLLKSTPKKSTNDFSWEEDLKFNVKEIDTQVIEIGIWEKRFLPDTLVGSFCIELSSVIEKKELETITELRTTLDDGMGEILVDIFYQPNQEEISRLQQEKEKREQQSRSTGVSPEFDFLLS